MDCLPRGGFRRCASCAAIGGRGGQTMMATMTIEWSKGHCAVGMSMATLASGWISGKCSVYATRGSSVPTTGGGEVKSAAAAASPSVGASDASPTFHATTKSFKEMSKTPVLHTCVWKSVRDLETVLCVLQTASEDMMPRLVSVSWSTSALDVFESIPMQNASGRLSRSQRNFASSGMNVFVTSLPPLPCTAHKTRGTVHAPFSGAARSPGESIICEVHLAGVSLYAEPGLEGARGSLCRRAWTTTVRDSVVFQSSYVFVPPCSASPRASRTDRQPAWDVSKFSSPAAKRSLRKSRAVSPAQWMAYLSSNVEKRRSPSCDFSRSSLAIITRS
mmetsp:Transcript_1180/g.3658  ORF Transcript_1180/g.3658 Transcript_1180/m.3658 type:complete len:332 (+) Transcript_1180:1164-2159(+)